MACYSPLKGYRNTNGALVFKQSSHTVGKMEVACGQCLGCRSDRTLMWAMRIVHESCMHADAYGNSWITLTYRSRDECNSKQIKNGLYVPGDYSLNYRHFRDFLKRLRRHFPQKIRYFHCGEYGEENLRPHYHACLFNCQFDDEVVEKSEDGITSYSSATLSKLWGYGFCTIGELNYETAAYTAGYILKKITGIKSLDAYLRNDENGVAFWVKPPYVTMSLRPGIGADFYEKYKNDFFPSDESPVPGKGTIRKVPRFYEEILKREDPDVHQLVRNKRQLWIGEHRDDFTPERLMAKYRCARARSIQQKRTL